MKLLLNPGAGWSATTPFLYTLSYDQQYCHCGHQKESGYLRNVYSTDTENNIKTVLQGYWSASDAKINSPMGQVLSVKNKYVQHFDSKFLEHFFSAPYTIEKYVEYYKKHFEAIKDTYESVADFSNFNFTLPEQFLQKIAPYLMENFEVKVTFQFRDPIKRYFSEIGSNILQNFDSDLNLKEKIYKKGKKQKKMFDYRTEKQKFSPFCDFVSAYEKFERVFGKENCYYVIMEEFWTQKEELERLSDFLSYKITKLHENCYVPDMRSKAPRYEWLKDQWESDIEDIGPIEITIGKTRMKHFYDDFMKKFGKIPDSWVDIRNV